MYVTANGAYMFYRGEQGRIQGQSPMKLIATQPIILICLFSFLKFRPLELVMFKQSSIIRHTHTDPRMYTERGESEYGWWLVSTLTFLLGYYDIILWYPRHYHWGKLAEGHTGSLCIISYNCMRIRMIISKSKAKEKQEWVQNIKMPFSFSNMRLHCASRHVRCSSASRYTHKTHI